MVKVATEESKALKEASKVGTLGTVLKESESRTALKLVGIDATEFPCKAEFRNGWEEGVKRIMNEVKQAGQGLKPTAGAAMINVFASAFDFGKAMGMEAARGSAFEDGANCVRTVMTALTNQNPTPENAQRAETIAEVKKTNETLFSIADDWMNWLSMHFGQQDSFGTVSVFGIDVTLFQVLQDKFSSLSAIQQGKVAPAMTKALQNKTLEAANAVVRADMELVNAMMGISAEVKGREQQMMAAGLKDYSADICAALISLQSIGKSTAGAQDSGTKIAT